MKINETPCKKIRKKSNFNRFLIIKNRLKFDFFLIFFYMSSTLLLGPLFIRNKQKQKTKNGKRSKRT
jgi:hypothetical protein